MTDHRAAARAERQALDVSALAEFAADRILGRSRPHVGIAHRQRADALRGGEIPLEQERRRPQRRGDVVEAEVGAVARQPVASRRCRAPADRESRCHTRCGSSDASRSGPGVSAPCQARSSDPASQLVKPTYSRFVRVRHALRRHRAHAQLAEHALPGLGVRQQVVETGRLEVHRIVRLATPCGCCGSRRSTCSTRRDVSPPRPPVPAAARRRARPTAYEPRADRRARAGAVCASMTAAPMQTSAALVNSRVHRPLLLRATSAAAASVDRLLHRLVIVFFVVLWSRHLVVVVASRRRPSRPSCRRLLDRGGGTGAGSSGPSCISSRSAAITSSRVSRLGLKASGSLLFPGGGGGSGFSASCSGVRLSLLTASSFAPARDQRANDLHLPRLTAWCSGVEPSGALTFGSAPAASSTLSASSGSRFDASRNGGGPRRLESGTSGERRAATARHRDHDRRLADVGVPAAATAAAAPALGSFLTSARTPFDLGAVRDHQLQHLDVGRDARPDRTARR